MAKPASDPAKPKGSKRARTRAALVDAAAQLVGTQGLERTSLEDVAQQAGMTRGAIYGNFKDRDELFLAVMDARWQPVVPAFRPGASYEQQMSILADAVIAALPARRIASIGAASFQFYALTHEKMRARFVQINAEAYRRAVQEILEFIPERDLPMPPKIFVRVLHALIDGLTFLSFLTPELINEEVIRAAFQALGTSRVSPRGR